MGANLHVQNQEMLQLYKMNFDFHLAKTGKDDIMHKGANLHNCMCKIRKILQLYKMKFDFHLARKGDNDIF